MKVVISNLNELKHGVNSVVDFGFCSKENEGMPAASNSGTSMSCEHAQKKKSTYIKLYHISCHESASSRSNQEDYDLAYTYLLLAQTAKVAAAQAAAAEAVATVGAALQCMLSLLRRADQQRQWPLGLCAWRSVGWKLAAVQLQCGPGLQDWHPAWQSTQRWTLDGVWLRWMVLGVPEHK
eukprot:scaffold99190_cov20-Tisochrysis_lutea.AAC.1